MQCLQTRVKTRSSLQCKSNLIMGDAVALRREARRKKILENSGSRLKKIADLPTAFGSTDSAYHRSHLEGDSRSFNIPTVPQVFEELPDVLHIVKRSTSEEEVQDLPSNFALHESQDIVPKQVTNKSVQKLLYSDQFHVVVLAILTFTSVYLGFGNYFWDNIICPFITFQLTKLPQYFLSNSSNVNPTLKLLLSVLQVRNINIMPFLELIFFFTNLMKEFFLYLFVFVFINDIEFFGFEVATINYEM